MGFFNRDRGSLIHGTNGSVLLDRNGYEVYDLDGKKTAEYTTGNKNSSRDLLSRDSMTDAHFANFIDAIRTGAALHSSIEIASISVTMLLLANMAWTTNHELAVDTQTASYHQRSPCDDDVVSEVPEGLGVTV